MLVRRYCLSTVKSYRYWIKLFIIVDGKSPLTEGAGTSMELVFVIPPVSAARHDTLVVLRLEQKGPGGVPSRQGALEAHGEFITVGTRQAVLLQQGGLRCVDALTPASK